MVYAKKKYGARLMNKTGSLDSAIKGEPNHGSGKLYTSGPKLPYKKL